jgi:hypothetical protein
MTRQWEDVKKGVRQGISTAVERVEHMARIGKVKLDISTIKRGISNAENQLGRHVYELASSGKTKIAEDLTVKQLVEKIAGLGSDLQDRQARLEEIKKEKETKKQEAVPGEEKAL